MDNSADIIPSTDAWTNRRIGRDHVGVNLNLID